MRLEFVPLSSTPAVVKVYSPKVHLVCSLTSSTVGPAFRCDVHASIAVSKLTGIQTTAMKLLLIFLLMVTVTSLASTAGEDIKCYFCKSRVSFKDCDENKRRVQCGGEFGLNRCVKAHIKASRQIQETYQRGCQSASACDAHPCKTRGDDTCQVHCCTGDYCNKSTTRMVSGTILFIFSVLVVLMG